MNIVPAQSSQSVLDRIRSEPVLVTELVQAVLVLAVAFGLDLTGTQTAAIVALTNAVLAVLVRRVVTPTASTDAPPDPYSRL